MLVADHGGLSPMQDYFMKLVDNTVETSVRHVRSFVHQYLAARLVEARSAIEDYGQRYAEAMLSALDTSKKGVHGPPNALRQETEHFHLVCCTWVSCTYPRPEHTLACFSTVNMQYMQQRFNLRVRLNGR